MRKYLVVDDNRAFAENLSEILREAGNSVVLCESGAEAVDHVRTEKFDAILTDMKMPGMNGAELISQIRKFDAGVPIIVCTAFAQDEFLSLARQQGVYEVLNKPFSVPLAVERLSTAARDSFVALIEDDESLLDNLMEACREKGWTPLAATSLQEAMCMKNVKPFAAVVDLKLPGSEFGEAVPTLRNAFPDMPVVVMSAYATDEVAPRADAFFEKPFETRMLLETLEAFRERAIA